MQTSRIHAVARRSAVEPGCAVRVLATMTDPDGIALTTDLTAFGSQSAYRSGYFRRNGSRYALFTSVRQDGDRFWVTASLNRRFQPPGTGTIALRSGETGDILLDNGQVVTVTHPAPGNPRRGRRRRARDPQHDRQIRPPERQRLARSHMPRRLPRNPADA